MFTKCIISIIFLACLYFIVTSSSHYANYLITSGWDNATIPVERSRIFDMYLKKFNKSYGYDEYPRRLAIFRESMKEIARLNGITGARHGWTKFTDMSEEELSQFLLSPRSDPGCASSYEVCTSNVNETIIPKNKSQKVDWRTKGAVGPVLDQLRCGCCWAMSIVGTMESMGVIRGYGYQQLSVQELMDCSTYNKGCEGGDMTALYYLCKHELALATEDHRSHDGLSRNHMVQIVGFDLTGSVPYYIVKNTWGPLYGEEGYVKLATNRNMCGLAEEVAYLDVF
ncbi:hypothetical protein O3G_MSEX001215 [Manduca sexta]|uniref:Uncharacterized protein n=1 Tax=Manduca sexta TaxID=7130 RepID=A0A921YJD1_MANSE|nr:hypothetical protein O3G_MSEX001215 [Manduca sexta]KAG6440260.1 hypothetical protein O3G_MSEX001215 [Manduca sexta]